MFDFSFLFFLCDVFQMERFPWTEEQQEHQDEEGTGPSSVVLMLSLRPGVSTSPLALYAVIAPFIAAVGSQSMSIR